MGKKKKDIFSLGILIQWLKKSLELCSRNTSSRKFDKGIISAVEFLVTINKGLRQKRMSAVNTAINLCFHTAKIMWNSIYSKLKWSPPSQCQHFGPLPFDPHFPQAEFWHLALIDLFSIKPKSETLGSFQEAQPKYPKKSLTKWDTSKIPQ